MLKICVITGGRAEYGILHPLIKLIHKSKKTKLFLITTGMHNAKTFGETSKEIEKDKLPIHSKIEMQVDNDTPQSVCKSIGLGSILLSDELVKVNPDYVILLGDRYETFMSATVSMILRIPIVHIQGGEVTKGAIDDQFRHSISKLSNIHFVYTETYRKRVIQLGENPNYVFNFGALNVDSLSRVKKIKKNELEKLLDLKLLKNVAVVTYHSVTLSPNSSKKDFEEILKALQSIENLQIIFTKTNSDTDGRVINKLIDEFVKNNEDRSASFVSLGQLRYINLLRYASLMIGNSSSGIIETPYFKLPVVNIGDRQEGRILAQNIINTPPSYYLVKKAIIKALSPKFQKSLKNMTDPYFKENTANKIFSKITSLKKISHTKKKFFDL